MGDSLIAKVLQHKERFMKEAEDLLLKEFPATILKLNTLLATPKFKKRDFSDMQLNFDISSMFDPILEYGDRTVSPPTKRARCENPKIPSALLQTNKILIDLIETVKPHMRKLVEDTKTMKLWLSLMIPKIEDGNNFGVEIQGETLHLVHAIEATAAPFYERVCAYYNTRAKIVKKILKFPEIEDFRQSLQELDEKEYLGFCLDLIEIRDHYCTMHDVFTKNLDKIKKPRPLQPMASLY